MSITAENVIGGIAMVGKDAYWRVADLIKPEDFPVPVMGNLYKLCAELESLDLKLLAEEAEKRGICEAGYVLDLVSHTASAANLRGWAERLLDDATQRRFRAVCREGAETGDILAVQAAIGDLMANRPAGVVKAKDALREMWDDVMARYARGDALAGLTTGFPLLDEMTGGLQPGRVYGIGARAKMGKTVLAMNLCAHNALAGRHVAVWSLEMTKAELMGRMVCAVSGKPSVLLQRPVLFNDAPEDMRAMGAAMADLSASRLTISDRMDVTIEDIEAQARMLRAKGELDLLCIDYLGLLRMPRADRHDLAVAHNTRRIKIIAKELQIPVLMVFQLSRNSEKGTEVRPPRPSDARDSGAIEQDVDAMILLHRPSYYDKNAQPGLRLDLAIQRNGPTGLIHLNDELDRCRFTGGEHAWNDPKAATGGRDDDL